MGCGWLGLPLAESLLAEGYDVFGSTTHPDKLPVLEASGIKPFLIELDQQNSQVPAQFLDADLLIINIPPGRKKPEEYLPRLSLLKDRIEISKVRHILFISSTAVYAPETEQADEQASIGEEEKSQRLFQAEEMFRHLPNTATTILRLAGLIGPKRHPGRFFSGKSEIDNGLAPVNLVHLEDCIRLIKEIISQNYWNQTLHLAAPTHPTKKDFYTEATARYGGILPLFKNEQLSNKIIDPQKAIAELGFEFNHPDLILSLSKGVYE